MSVLRTVDVWHSIDQTDEVLLHRCRDAVRSVVPTASIILYGSRARGDARPDSDYDLLVLVDEPPTLAMEGRIRDVLYPIELDTGAVLTLLVESREAWRTPLYQAMPFAQSVERDGVIL